MPVTAAPVFLAKSSGPAATLRGILEPRWQRARVIGREG